MGLLHFAQSKDIENIGTAQFLGLFVTNKAVGQTRHLSWIYALSSYWLVPKMSSHTSRGVPQKWMCLPKKKKAQHL